MYSSQFLIKKYRCIVSLMLLTLPLSLFAAPQWYSLGLSDRAVHCICADDSSVIIAGTDSGVSVYWNAKWYHIPMLPVKAIARVSSMSVTVAAGNGSNSDGVYIGKNIINGPPFYAFTLGDYFPSPTALAVGPAVSKAASAADIPLVLYVGGQNSFAWGLLRKDSLSKLNSVPMPEYAFGVESPFCAAIQIFNNQPFTGGYERNLSMPARSYLLSYDFQDSLWKVRPMKTTAMSQGRFRSLFGGNLAMMAIADLDSGVFFYNQAAGNPWYRIAGPAGGPVVSLYSGIAQSMQGTNRDTTLYAASRDGVFQCESGEPGPIWVKLGTLPAEPYFLTGVGAKGNLLVGTAAGVYRYGENGTGVMNGCTTAGTIKIVFDNKKHRLSIIVKPSTGIDLKGRSVKHRYATSPIIDHCVERAH
jgi:hypothetical protein